MHNQIFIPLFWGSMETYKQCIHLSRNHMKGFFIIELWKKIFLVKRFAWYKTRNKIIKYQFFEVIFEVGQKIWILIISKKLLFLTEPNFFLLTIENYVEICNFHRSTMKNRFCDLKKKLHIDSTFTLILLMNNNFVNFYPERFKT